jgi:hypothetical protein
MSADRMTRFEASLFEAAIAEGGRENRSARQQLEHWARIGMEISAHETAPRRKITAAVRGEIPLSDLSPAEQRVANVELDVAIEERAAAASFGRDLLEAGLPIVVLNEAGELRELFPDGSSRPLVKTPVSAPFE